MNELFEIRHKLVNLWHDLDERFDQYACQRLSAVISDIDDKINEYDRYVDEMANAHESYEDRIVAAGV